MGGVEALLKRLKSSPNGLSGDKKDLKLRSETFGSNNMPSPDPKSWIELFVGAFEDTTVWWHPPVLLV